MTSRPPHIPTDPVRASRDGHAYHEAWAARVALELVIPTTDLVGITMEGFSAEDVSGLSADAQEIADLVRYRGSPDACKAAGVEVVQFKYSISREHVPARAAYLAKTLKKFAKVDGDFVTKLGLERAQTIIFYEFATNRPFHPDLLAAVDGLCRGITLDAQQEAQAEAIREATNLEGDALAGFLRRLTLSGEGGSLAEADFAVHRTVADWGGAGDALARMRLGDLRKLVRDKAGGAGQRNNMIVRYDVLGALDIAHEEDLFPTPDAFPEIGPVIDRPIIKKVMTVIEAERLPVLVHAPGGMGKTVVMQTIAREFERAGAAVVLFDGFGGGNWRDPADARHLPKKAMPHIVNLLAGQGLCDLLLPSPASEDMIRSCRLRLIQAVGRLRQADPLARVVLVLDAIDHAGLAAAEGRTESFAHLLLESLSLNPINGVVVVASCRTERRDIARGRAHCRELEIPSFSPTETSLLVKQRDPTAGTTDIAALHARAGGNPRCVDALIRAGRPYDGPVPGAEAQTGNVLDDLLKEQINKALRAAELKGAAPGEFHGLLAGLALLPPPVPLEELAAAQARPSAAIESFVADMFPLLDRTPHGLVFRDEPTETLVRKMGKGDRSGREAVVQRLQDRQESSVYAARALPLVLTTLNLIDKLVELALDHRVPHTVTSQVGQREIRLSRLTAAMTVCAKAERMDDLVRLMLEASRVAGGHERSDAFLRDHPDLVAVSGDPEALRRLSEARAPWQGARHAALALAYTLMEDNIEAQRNANRAFGWLDWDAEQPDRERHERKIRDQDHFGPAYAALMYGRPGAIALWFQGWKEWYAYSLLDRITILLEQHATLNPRMVQRRAEFIELASRCRLMSRPLICAVLRNGAVTEDQERRFVRRLAEASKGTKREEGHWGSSRKYPRLEDGLLHAALRAARLGMKAEALAILDGIVLKLRLYHLDSHWPDEPEIRHYVMAAGIRAAVEGRVPALLDVAPEEIVEAAGLPKQGNRFKAFEANVEKLLAEPDYQAGAARRKRAKPKLDYEKRQEYTRALAHRVRPLISYAADVASLIVGPACEQVLIKALDRMEAEVKAAGEYPYRTQRRYLAHVGFGVLFTCADALGLLSSDIARRLGGWLADSPIRQTSVWTATVHRLSRHEEAQEAALALAQAVDGELQKDRDVDARIWGYGALARAVFGASVPEARAYFRRGLDMAEEIGSNDYDKTMEVIRFAERYSGQTLSPESFHAFARICELNLPEEVEKFAWVEFGRATSRLSGAPSLAILARWADRDVVGLNWSLPPLLTTLAKEKRLAPELALSLIGLDEPTETYLWDLSAFARAVLPLLSDDQRNGMIDILLQEIDRQHQAAPLSDSLERLIEIIIPLVKPTCSALKRLRQLQREGARDDDGDALRAAVRENEEKPNGLADVDLADPDAIDRFLAEQDDHGKEWRWTGGSLRQLAQRIRRPDDRQRFLEAVCQTVIPSLADKLLVMAEVAEVWRKTSVAAGQEMPALARQLAARHARELVQSGWEASGNLRDLTNLGDGQGGHLVPAILAGLGDEALNVGSSTWLALAGLAADGADSHVTGAALERFLLAIADDLPDDLGDGPWADALCVEDDTTEIVAGLLWQRLGAPDARARWRAAHALRRLVRFGHTEILAALVSRIGAQDAGAFQDGKLPFYFLHAKLWLLITLARIARDNPQAIEPFRDSLEAIAFDPAFPHVVMRHFAADALKKVCRIIAEPERDALMARLAVVNASPYPRAKGRAKRYRGIYDVRPQDVKRKFYFDHDFKKNNIDHFARLFDVPVWEVEEACDKWLGRWCKSPSDAYKVRRSEGDRWGGGQTSQHDCWGDYLAWHALMAVAGEYLGNMPILGDSWQDDPWGYRLGTELLSMPDALLLADGTDFYPPELRRKVGGQGDELVTREPAKLASLAGLEVGYKLGEDLVVDGHWTSIEGISISITSVMLAPSIAREAALSVALMGAHFQWLPGDDNELGGQVQQLVHTEDISERGIDQSDPYGTSAALRRAKPKQEIIDDFGLMAADSFGRVWTDADGRVVFRAEAWGATNGTGRHAKEDRGTRLWCRVETVKELLSARGMSLILLIKAERYIENAKTDDDHFVTRTLLVIVDSSGRAKPLLRIPAKVRKAIAGLHHHDRSDLKLCLDALQRIEAN